MSASQVKRTVPEDPTEPAHPLPKVRLITQPQFGHELCQAQQTIAVLKGEVAVSAWAEKVAKGQVSSMQNDLDELRKCRDELEEEIAELQEAESTELQRLGAENIALTREVSRKNIEIQALQNLLKELGLLTMVSTQTQAPSKSIQDEDAEKNDETTNKNTETDEEDQGAQAPSESARGEDAEKNDQATNENTETNEDQDVTQHASKGRDNAEDLFEREASVLRNLEANVNTTYRVIYPLDALPNRQAQNWFHQAFNYVDVDLGPEYADFLIQWIEFERFHLWKKSNGRLASSKRPKEITDWINGGRYPPRYKGPRVEGDFVRQFSNEMKDWWISLQLLTPLNPDGRNNDWTSLNRSGLNGWFSIVVGLKWWGHGLRGLQGEVLNRSSQEWVTTVQDVNVALERLLENLK
ncbi:SERTA domain-containing protein 3 [Stygiomarasmius scandens]|uniref:SERTA domain-containing protein 3 n=1 Tax=Marasmiellus scandens TaxID=2682957 RepID=A0ABR1IVQ9_9AGAR